MDDEKTLNAIIPYWNRLPHLRKIIVWGAPIPNVQYSSDVLHWNDVIKLGMEDSSDKPVLKRQRKMAINQCCILVYTSGTTGNPKGNLF